MLADDILDKDIEKQVAVQNKKVRFSTFLAVWITNVTSNILSFLFIMILLEVSLFDYFFRVYLLGINKYVKPNVEAFPNLDDNVDKKRSKKPKVQNELRYYAQLLGLELSSFKITTEDGFIITLYRLYDPNDFFEDINLKKPVFLLPGILNTSSAYITTGRKGLAYTMWKNGYDVWLGDGRCGLHPRHTEYSIRDVRLWNWDLEDLAKYDLPCMIAELLKVNKSNQKLSIISHSQGTVMCSYLFSNFYKTIYENNVDKCIMLAPAVFGGTLFKNNLVIQFVRNIPHSLFSLMFSVCAFVPIVEHSRNLFYKSPMYAIVINAFYTFALRGNDYKWDKSLRKYHCAFIPSWVSVKLINWWLRGKEGGRLSAGKPVIKSENEWFNENCPELFIIYGGCDKIVDGKSFVARLNDKEKHLKGKVQSIELKDYDHMDFMFADDLLDTISEKILAFIK